MSFAERFEEARKRAGLSIATIAKRLGVSVQSVYLWQQGSIPKPARLRELADLLGVSLQWLMYGNEEPHSVMDHQNGVVVVPQLNIEPSAGFGGFIDSESDCVVKMIGLSAEWLNQTLPGVNRQSLVVHSVSGDSMKPTLKDHDFVLLDTSVERATRDGLYIVGFDGLLFAKRIQVLPGRKLSLISDNDAYKPITIDLTDESCAFRVIGRIVYSWTGEKR